MVPDVGAYGGRVITNTQQIRVLTARSLAHCAVDVTDGDVLARTPITGGGLGGVPLTSSAELDAAIERAGAAFATWRTTPAPVRGELVRRFGNLVRQHLDDLALLVTIEAGKIGSEARGEIQEVVDICDFAVGLSRQLYGKSIASERPAHRLTETWQPLGPIGVVTAFNFPAAVWAWNAAIALVCGDPVIWKPSDKTSLTALACHRLLERAAADVGAPDGLTQVVIGGPELALALADDARVALVSATGSTAMGQALAPRIAARLGRSLLELGGNNAAIVAASADVDLAVRAIVFAAAGTAGQRCTTLRRLIVHRSVAGDLLDRVAAAYGSLPIDDPLDDDTLVGPLIGAPSHAAFAAAIKQATADGGDVLAGGGRVLADLAPDAFYVEPALVRMPAQSAAMHEETFAPLLYAVEYDDLDEAIHLNNEVPQGLASSIFTSDVREAEWFCSAAGSDCGIVNVNIGPSGAEIGGAFGGEKATGGGREAGSDSWKAYMRRATTTVNFSGELPLAQGVTFL
jgi:aldehyde dehydrogenase (NAD+)